MSFVVEHLAVVRPLVEENFAIVWPTVWGLVFVALAISGVLS